jgi:hypothetical protein
LYPKPQAESTSKATARCGGEFTLKTVGTGTVALTGFAPGYYIAGPVTAKAGDAGVTISLRKLPTVDNRGSEMKALIQRV